MNNPFISLKYKNFRYYLFGMLISNIGTWMQNISQPWLAYQITDNAFKIGLVSAMQYIPMMLFSLFAGAIIERTNKKNMLFITQSILLATTMLFSVLIFTNLIKYWHILILAAIMGTANAFDRPIRQSFVVEMVPKEDLMNAIALNSTGFNLARVIGPSIAGVVLALYGVGVCFLVNSLSFIAVMISLFFIKPINRQILKTNENEKTYNRFKLICQDVKQGLIYLVKRKELLSVIISTFVISCFTMNHNVLLPVYVTKVLNMNETSYGFIMSCMGVGSFFGAFLIAFHSRKGPSNFNLTIGPMLTGVCLLAVGILKNYYLTFILYMFIGFFYVSYSATVNTFIQLKVDDGYRSRLMSIFVLVNGGSTPLGSLFTGIVVELFNAPAGFIANGAVVAVFMLIFMLTVSIYKK